MRGIVFQRIALHGQGMRRQATQCPVRRAQSTKRSHYQSAERFSVLRAAMRMIPRARRMRNALRHATRVPQRLRDYTDESDREVRRRRYGSSDATSSQCTAMKARAVTALWRRTERRERVVKTERNRRAVGLSQVPSAMVRSERGSAALRPRSHLTKGSWTLTMTPDWMFDVLNVPSGRTRHALNELGRRLVALGVYAKQPMGPACALGAA